MLASTTSTEDSGLFDELLPAFEKANPKYRIVVVAVGSGEALAIARRGDADVLLVHSPAAESTFMAEGYGDTRRAVMYNDFVIVGDSSDPARIRGQRAAAAALAQIARTRSHFVSRGDQSGTHTKELLLWKAAAIEPDSKAAVRWYMDVGQGMGETLRIANERRAYTLSDRGTYLASKNSIELLILVEGDPQLRNPYSVITVKAAKNKAGAQQFADWIVSGPAQQLIGAFGVARVGQPLFIPDAH